MNAFGRTRWSLLLLAGLALGSLFTMAKPAAACGGFWCSQTAPVEQTREQIIFSQNPDGTVTCVVQIAYSGPSQRFAWLLPVAGVPKIGVSSNVAFDRLTAATQPSFQLTRHMEGQCDQPQYSPGYYGSGGAAATFGADAGAAAPPPVQVLDQGSVGPYDYVTISVDPKLPSPADAALNWLTGEGFDVVGITANVLGPYLADGMNLLAFRLTKGTETGSIRPVVITYPGDRPSIPIKPTAVAAQNDMGILVWVLAEHQAVPQNYRSLVLNEALINWFNPMGTYDQVVTAAANEAGGQGFVTELAGPSSTLSGTVFSTSDAQGWADLQTQTFTDPIQLIFYANGYYRSWDGWRQSIEAAVTLPPGASMDDFGRNPDAYRNMPGFSVDTAVFLEHLRTDVVEPVQKTQELIDSLPYVTRLYSTMSADEMTADPVFTFNADLAPVSNRHTADLYIECRAGIMEYQAPWRIVLPQGGTVAGGSQTGSWPLAYGGSMPANRKIVQLSESGSGEIIKDNTAAIASLIIGSGGWNTPPTLKPTPADAGMPIGGYDRMPSASSDPGGTCACEVPGGRRPAALLLVVLAIAAGLVRRRHRA